MPFLKFFRGKKIKEREKTDKEGKRIVKGLKKAPKPKKESEAVEKAPSPKTEPKLKKGEIKTAPKVLKSPQITEKATYLQKEGQYIFKVFPGATKSEIKKSIKEVYGVDVLQVRVINVPDKRKRLGRSAGWQSGYRKAIVKIKPGQSIEVLPR